METGDNHDVVPIQQIEEAIGEATEKRAANLLVDDRIGLWVTFDSCQAGFYRSHELRPESLCPPFIPLIETACVTGASLPSP
jgi:hypothetical protein